MSPLYKFISDIDAVKNILAGNVKFTPISELNDPSEMTPTLNDQDILDSLKHMQQHGYSECDMKFLRQQGNILRTLAPRFKAIPIPNNSVEANSIIKSSYYETHFDQIKQLFMETSQEIVSKVGVLCLTNHYHCLPMWAHYANNSKGFVIEFINLDQPFKGDETGVLRQVRQITYNGEKCGITFEPRSHENGFFSKYKDWSYEQEFRVVMPLVDCEQQNINQVQVHIYKIPKNCINRIILGWQTSDEQTIEIKQQVKEINPAVEVCRAQFSNGSIEIIEL
jgi:hypothetical protein